MDFDVEVHSWGDYQTVALIAIWGDYQTIALIVAIKKAKLERDEDGITATTLHEISILRMLSQNLNIGR